MRAIARVRVPSANRAVAASCEGSRVAPRATRAVEGPRRLVGARRAKGPTPAARRRALVGVAMFYLVATMAARRRGYSGLGGRTLVRCRSGHLYRTHWVPGVSLKSLRLGWWRLQYCPVGRHWSVVSPIKDGDLSEEERALSLVPNDVAIL